MDTTKRFISVGTLIFVFISVALIFNLNSKDLEQGNELLNTGKVNNESSSIENIVNKIVESENKTAVLSGTLKKFEKKLTGSEIITENGILSIVNKERKSRNIHELVLNEMLNESAKNKAKDIIENQYFAHTAPDGKKVDDLVGEVKYEYIKVGENLALGEFVNDADVMNAWMNSPGHKANILDSQFDELGVGIANGTYEGSTVFVVVQHFGRPASDCPEVPESMIADYELNKAKVQDIENELTVVKNTVDEGRANGKLMNEEANYFNELNQKYKSLFNELENMRLFYNEQVRIHNLCLDQ